MREDELPRVPATSADFIRTTVQDALDRQLILPPQFVTSSPILSGGTNMCPNSDFAWSYLAATAAGTLPGDAGATNLEVYRVTRQIVEANISAQRLRTVEADAWVPIWERVSGVAEIGAVSGADNYDVAFQFTNNWLVGNHKWNIRVAIATSDDTPLPIGTKIFVGFWVKRTGGSEGWVTGGNFTVASKIFGAEGTRHLNYKVIAKTDSGVSLESQVLSLTNAPDTLDQSNYIRLSYPAASGFTEFFVYREDVATGEIREIARDRNSSKLFAYDMGQSGKLETGGFPAVDGDQFRAYAETAIDAVSIDVQKTFHNLAVTVPPNFDTSTVVSEGTYLRIGIVGPTTLNRQVFIDTIWAAESFNVWGPSAYDVYPSGPSTTMTTAPPIGGGSPIDPPPSGGGNNCVWVGHDLLIPEGWDRLGDVEEGSLCDSGTEKPNTIDHFNDGEESQYLFLRFEHGLYILASLSHRFTRGLDDESGIMASYLKTGDSISGGCVGVGDFDIKLVGTELVTDDSHLRVRAVRMKHGSPNKFYAIGNRKTGYYVRCHNRKEDLING